jgi:hypothetical protein
MRRVKRRSEGGNSNWPTSSAVVAVRAALIGALGLTVTLAAGCDKLTAALKSGTTPKTTSAQTMARGPELDIRQKPTILFEVFGERDDPRMIPIAVIQGGKLRPIRLTPNAWHAFDRMYAHPGAQYTLYQDGHDAGVATVKQGMWSRSDAPLYSLPGCRNLIPMAAVSLASTVRAGITVEFLATSAPLPPSHGGTDMAPTAAATLARDIGGRVADAAHIPRPRLDSLDFHAVAINTGATHDPTLVISYVDPNAEEAAAHGDETSYLFAIADKKGSDYSASFRQVVNGSATHAVYRRFVDHLDLTGEGVDEIVLEGWQYGGDTYPMIMRYKDGQWREVLRGSSTWCLDSQQKTDVGS